MRLGGGFDLGYCTNVHRGEGWEEVFGSLERFVLGVRRRVCGEGELFGIGLRLGARAARELSVPGVLDGFRRWLDREGCYVFTLNGFPYGAFHGGRVKEGVYRPDWSCGERLEYTCLLFDLLGVLLPEGVAGSVSTVPVSFKGWLDGDGVRAAMDNLWRCVEYVEGVCDRCGRVMCLGLEPEPLCFLETSLEVVRFFEGLRGLRRGDDRLDRFLGVTYDCCHLAVEFEGVEEGLGLLVDGGVRLCKVHLSSALRLCPSRVGREGLGVFDDGVYLHQVVERFGDGGLRRFVDLGDALAAAEGGVVGEEWRVHFHVPLYAEPGGVFGTTVGHLLGVLDFLRGHRGLCGHLELETYTWEVLPVGLRERGVVDQLVGEFGWVLGALGERGLA